jgi:hypothetical protein
LFSFCSMLMQSILPLTLRTVLRCSSSCLIASRAGTKPAQQDNLVSRYQNCSPRQLGEQVPNLLTKAVLVSRYKPAHQGCLGEQIQTLFTKAVLVSRRVPAHQGCLGERFVTCSPS